MTVPFILPYPVTNLPLSSPFLPPFLLAGCQGLSIAMPEHQAPRYTAVRGGLQADILYQYKYTGTVATWVSEDPTQFSGSALRADVEVERTQVGNLRVKVRWSQVYEACVKD